ncbi:response regulator transcription factor [Streptomyces sp. NPDC050610]|uniref:response regulator transcription factor n=1 Tax=Streptomyces sp. NPDC050610 TaxID=3157097 RepID=UPI00342FB717
MGVRLLLTDDQAVTRAGFEALLTRTPDLTVVGEAAGPDAAVDLAERLKPDVILINLRGLDRVQLALLMKRLRCPGCAPDSAVLLVECPENGIGFADVLAAGGSGCVTQDAARGALVSAVMLVSHGGVACLPGDGLRRLLADRRTADEECPPSVHSLHSLTDRETAVLGLLAQGLSNGEMAAELHLAVTTVKKHLAGAMRKIDEPNRVRAALFAFRHRLNAQAAHRD